MQTSHDELQKQKIARQLLEVQLAFVHVFQRGFSRWKATVLPQFSVVVARLGSKCYHLTREIKDLGWV